LATGEFDISGIVLCRHDGSKTNVIDPGVECQVYASRGM
jgi:hypothetical protein